MEILVVQAATSGPNGFPYDEIMGIAVCMADPDTSECSLLYENTVFREPKYLGKGKLDFIEKTFGITPGDIYAGEPERKVAEEIMDLISGKCIACYDSKQEFGRYMLSAPWDITGKATVMPSISARMPISLRCKVPSDEPDIIYKAYHRLFKDDPAKVGKGRRPADLALMSCHLMFHMRGRGKY